MVAQSLDLSIQTSSTIPITNVPIAAKVPNKSNSHVQTSNEVNTVSHLNFKMLQKVH